MTTLPNNTPSLFRKIVRFLTRSTFCLILIGTLLGFVTPERFISKLLPERIVVKEILKDSPEFDELVKEIPETYGIPAEVVKVVLQKESGGREGAKRYEPQHLERYGKRISSDLETAREYASSHCQFQIMGWHLKFAADGTRQDRGDWYDLYEPETCVKEFARVWLECEKRWKDAPSKVAKYQKVFECYNGSEKYAHDAMNRLARLAIEKI